MKEFLSYIFSNGIVKNESFLASLALPSYHNESFRFLVNNEISVNSTLKNPESSTPFTYLEIISLLKECDKALKNFNPNKDFNLITSSIIYKLIAYTGIAYREVIKLSVDKYDCDLGTVTIHGVTVHFPHKFTNQLNTYITMRSELAKTNKLFVKASGNELSEKTSSNVYWLSIFSGRQDLTGIIKYAIIEMLRSNINPFIIMKFTGVKDSIVKDCVSIVFKEQELMIGNTLRSMNIFEEL